MNNIWSLRCRAFLGLAGILLVCIVCGAWGTRAISAEIQVRSGGPNPCRTIGRWVASARLAVDKDDNVWVLDRPHDLRDMELRAELPNPFPIAAPCLPP